MRCSQTRIHSALPFTAQPLLFVYRLPPISFATQPVTNTVGYNTETTRAGYNYVIPAFRTVGGDKNATDIQLLQLGDGIGSYEVSFQFLTAKRRNAHTYNWISAEDAADYADDWPKGRGLWIDDETSALPEETVTVGVGNAVQMDMGDYDAEDLTCSGQVSDADLSYTTRSGYNYIGNPYPVALDIQNIQLSDALASYEVSFQFLTAKRRNAHTYDWISAEDAGDYADNWEKDLGLWIDDETSAFPEETVTIAPGGAVQLDMGDFNGEIVNVYAPIEL